MKFSGTNIEATKKDILDALSKVIIEKDVNLIVAATVNEKRCRDEVHISCGVRSKVSGKASLHPLVFP